MIPQEHVAYINPEVQAPQQYTGRYPAKSVYCRLFLDVGRASRISPVVPLELLVVFLQQRESNKTTTSGQKLNTPSKKDRITDA